MAAMLLTACSPSVETDPQRLVPVLTQAIKCCEGECTSDLLATFVSKENACGDVQQLQACLAGDEKQCPVKGYGAF